MFKILKSKKVLLAQTQLALEQQAVDFLLDNNIEVTPDTLALFGAAIQQGDQAEDSFNPEQVAKAIRKARASRFAFYLIHPDRKPKDEPVATGEHANEIED